MHDSRMFLSACSLSCGMKHREGISKCRQRHRGSIDIIYALYINRYSRSIYAAGAKPGAGDTIYQCTGSIAAENNAYNK